ncbi:hypothetical protein [Corallococcus carmarthensis]|uniref:Tc toxin subunit A-related protein n=1 Tax=Corallococcus carmarthensis TaxID=2316728 RepID=UPI00148CDEC8|nr:hypothetical protein [Corallococcus carmarthensis]NOK15895.1 hypothetical protein [Corallococcus carmarthensis]
MADGFHADIAYSFRKAKLVIDKVTPDNGALAAIEQLLVSAGQAYRARRYQDAIDLYEQARSILWSQLFPLIRLDETVAWAIDLSQTLLSYSVEWLNLLPIEQASTGVRPRELIAVGDLPVFGLLSGNVDPKASGATADLSLAIALEARGNAPSAKFFRDRAHAEAPELIAEIERVSTTPKSTPPVDSRPLRPGMARTTDSLHVDRSIAASRGVALEARLAAPEWPAPVEIPPQLTVARRAYSVKVGKAVRHVTWEVGQAPAVEQLVRDVYAQRRSLVALPDALITPNHAADVAVGLTHAWYYETPLGLAECHHAMGNWSAAEQWYLRAADYPYLNAAVEAPYVWTRLAALYRDWGDSLFRADDATAALPVYVKVLTADNQAPTSSLYTIPGLAPAVAAARNVIANLTKPADITASPAISSVIFDVQAQLAKIAGGLDFWGHSAQSVPIWTFDYLQSVAVNLCQMAVSTERDAMSFWDKADSGSLTRLQLTQNIAQTKAERDAAQRQVAAAQQELEVYRAGQAVARQRADDARANAVNYAAKSAAWSMHQALSAQMGGGANGNASELNALADRMMQGGYSLSGDRGTLTAAEQLTSSRLQNQYEIGRMNREASLLDALAAQAVQERAAAQARVVAAQASANASQVRVNGAVQLLGAFDQQRFTPDVWHLLGDKMNQLSQRYLAMALDVAKLMQRAYNFENDVVRTIIKPDYMSDTVKGMLAADTLMLDVQSFAFDLITHSTAKQQPVRQTVSLAQRYPFLFETQLRALGRMEFQTNLDDFDSVYPGTYAGRIEHVEVTVDGIVPTRGLSGTLTNSGISHYRMPTPWAADSDGIKHRVQPRESLVLSDYDLRNDAIIVESDRRRRRVFEGAGLASSWTLELPKEVNALDYQSIIDVRLTFTYQARFDPDMRALVLAELAARPQANQRQRPYPLRWLFPDAFFTFYGSGVLSLEFDRGDFAATENDPRLTEVSLVVVTTPRARSGGLVLRVSAPGKKFVTVTTAKDGTVAVTDLTALTGGMAIGDYRIELRAADNPSWVTDGSLALSPIENIGMALSYTFTPRT